MFCDKIDFVRYKFTIKFELHAEHRTTNNESRLVSVNAQTVRSKQTRKAGTKEQNGYACKAKVRNLVPNRTHSATKECGMSTMTAAEHHTNLVSMLSFSFAFSVSIRVQPL